MPGQLRMERHDYAGLPQAAIPDDYVLRSFRPGDEAAWSALINLAGDMGAWTPERACVELIDSPRFDPEALFFAEHAGTVVGTACAYPDAPDDLELGQLHMVATAPEHGGRGLGRAVSLAALRYFERRGFRRVYLLTDDWRSAALKLYLGLGFEPVMSGTNHAARWRSIREQLGV